MFLNSALQQFLRVHGLLVPRGVNVLVLPLANLESPSPDPKMPPCLEGGLPRRPASDAQRRFLTAAISWRWLLICGAVWTPLLPLGWLCFAKLPEKFALSECYVNAAAFILRTKKCEIANTDGTRVKMGDSRPWSSVLRERKGR